MGHAYACFAAASAEVRCDVYVKGIYILTDQRSIS